MVNNEMRFATYGRKSVYSDRSDSVKNQERMCREHAERLFPNQVASFQAYQDEGFTGANTDRPGLKLLLQDIKDGLIDVLIVYQLDRLSRNIRDFANIYAALEEKGVKFISVKESIDTGTPIGKAMMYVTMTFAQMERESIAMRVTDNFRGLALQGYWLTGTPSIGYKRKQINADGKKHWTLEIDEEGQKYIKSIFGDFLREGVSLNALKTTYRKSGKVSYHGYAYTPSIIWRLLKIPYYCQATDKAYEYFEALGCDMSGTDKKDWDGKHGVMMYGRKGAKGLQRPKEEWHMSVGRHPWIIPADDWLRAQAKLKENIFDKTMKYEVPLLKSIVKCGKCGRTMRVARKCYKDKVYSTYYCSKRDAEGREGCDMRSIACWMLDDKVKTVFTEIK